MLNPVGWTLPTWLRRKIAPIRRLQEFFTFKLLLSEGVWTIGHGFRPGSNAYHDLPKAPTQAMVEAGTTGMLSIFLEDLAGNRATFTRNLLIAEDSISLLSPSEIPGQH